MILRTLEKEILLQQYPNIFNVSKSFFEITNLQEGLDLS